MLKDFFIWKFFFRKEDEIEILKRNLIFKGLSTKEIQELTKYLVKRNYKKGEVIINYGEPGYALYIILNGKVSVEIPGENRKFIEIEELMPGEFFGEMALVTEAPRTATIRCKTDTTLCVLTRSSFEEAIKLNPKISVKILYNIAGVIAERLKKLNEQLSKEK
jgi:CRP-like cAMP-binding protein